MNYKEPRFSKTKQDKKPADEELYKRGQTTMLGARVKDPVSPCQSFKDQMREIKVGSAINKRLDFLEDRFSEGQSAYIFDVLGPMLEKKFIDEAAEVFDAFKDLNSKPMPEDNVNGEDNDMRFLQQKDDEDDSMPRVKINGLANGMKEFKWNVGIPPSDLIRVYTKGFYKSYMTPREFLGLAIEMSIAADGMEDCSNCLGGIRDKIRSLFEVIDSSQTGQFDTEDFYRALEHMDDDNPVVRKYKITHKMVNDFFLKTMELATATINLSEFQYGLMMGYMERMVDEDGNLNIRRNADQITLRQQKTKNF